MLQVSTNLKIAKDTRRKQGLAALLEVLLKLQQANNLQRALKCVRGVGREVKMGGGGGWCVSCNRIQAFSACLLAACMSTRLPCLPACSSLAFHHLPSPSIAFHRPSATAPHFFLGIFREAQESGEYAEAFWLCAQCTRSMEELGDGLRVAQEVSG